MLRLAPCHGLSTQDACDPRKVHENSKRSGVIENWVNKSKAATSRPTPKGLFPVALEGEGGPIVGGAPAPISPGRDLSRSERSGRAEALTQHRFIESAHQICGSPIVDLPQACYNPGSTRIHEAASETYEALALYLFAQRCLAGAQDNEIRLQLEIIYVVKPQEPILRVSLLVDKRQDDARQLGVFIVYQAMRCKVDY